LPGRHRILPIRDCLDHRARRFALDADVIAGARPEAGVVGQDAVAMAPGGGWISIHGREYRFRGLVQRSIVEQVYEAWRNGAGRLRTQEVLETAESSAGQLAHAFSGRPDFREIIGYDDGFCWLKVD
jgi:capsular polysaccharide biosynthesis protein